MNFHFQNIEFIWLLLIIPLCIIAFFVQEILRKKSLSKLAIQSNMPFLLQKTQLSYRFFYLSLTCLILLFIILAIMRPVGEEQKQEIEKSGRDIIFILDISKSMLSQDLKPNRLERAKQLILQVIQKLHSDRVALIVFSGSQILKSPLTLDYFFFKKIVNSVNVNDVVKGGTLIGDAILFALDFIGEESLYKDIILITDGEDHTSLPLEAARRATEKNIYIHTIGIGSTEGAIVVDDQGQALKYQGSIVQSKLDETTLKEIANITQGIYFPIHDKIVDLGELYTKYISGKERRIIEKQNIILWKEYFQYFVYIAIMLYCVDLLIKNTIKYTWIFRITSRIKRKL